jgi:hypothetical protein
VPLQGIRKRPRSAPVMALSRADLWPDDVPCSCVKRWERTAPFGTILVTVTSFTFSSRAALRRAHPLRHHRRRRAAELTAAAGAAREPSGRNGGETTKSLAGRRGETGAPAARWRTVRVHGGGIAGARDHGQTACQDRARRIRRRKAGDVKAGGRTLSFLRLRITDAGRRALNS